MITTKTGINATTKIFLRYVLSASLILGASTALAETTRVSVVDFSRDAANVKALEKGIASMRANNKANPKSPQYRTSLAYWSNTHGYFGEGGNSTNLLVYKKNRFPACVQQLDQKTCEDYFAHMVDSIVPDDGFTGDVWGSCQHGNLNFLPWHRMYIHYFEKTLRKQTGDKNFSLPFWDYYGEKSQNGKGLAIPALVRQSTENPLFNRWRTPGLNDNSSFVADKAASAYQAFLFKDFQEFSKKLESQPHGAIHCAVGTECVTPDMGFVPIAGLDPLFYMHHANIDRLWQCWLDRKANGQKIDLAWAKQNLGMPDAWYDTRYTFADENGRKVEVTIADVFDEDKFPRRYATNLRCDVPLLKEEAHLVAAAGVSALKNHGLLANMNKTVLRGKAQTVNLQPAPSLNLGASPLSESLQQSGDVYLVLEGVTFDGIPAVTYDIYISNKDQADKRVYVATFNLFGAGDTGHHHDHAAAEDLIFNVTEGIAKLGLTSADALSVEFIPATLSGQAIPQATVNTGISVGAVRLENTASRP